MLASYSWRDITPISTQGAYMTTYYINIYRTRHNDLVMSDAGHPHTKEDDAVDDIVLHESPIGGRDVLEYVETIYRTANSVEIINLRQAADEVASLDGDK